MLSACFERAFSTKSGGFCQNLSIKSASGIIIPMKTRIEGVRLIINVSPWVSGCSIRFSSPAILIALILSLSAAPDATTTLIGSVIGLGNIAGGLYMIRREPASIVEIDKAADEVRVCRWYPIGKRHKTYSLSDLSGAEVEITEHRRVVPFTGHGSVFVKPSPSRCRCSGIKPESQARPF